MSAALLRRPAFGRLARLVALFVVALSVESLNPSCSSGINTGPIRAFNRPVSVAFACIDTTSGDPVPTGNCTVSSLGVVPANLTMYALVPQETRGEVAAVDLIARTVLDSDRRIPGYTFVRVGTLPGAIVVPPLHPRCTYVANRGSNDITVLETRNFRSLTRSDEGHDAIVLMGSPADMVLESDGDVDVALWVALADLGQVARIPLLDECSYGAPEYFVLDEPVPPGVPEETTVDLARTCPIDFTPVPAATISPRDPDVDSTLIPEPTALAVDRESGVLLVADRQLPVIHRIALGDGAILTPIATGATVRDVVVTPRVPDTYASTTDAPATTFSRYLYAIDDEDGSVMAIEYSDESAPGFGAVLAIDVEGSTRPDRVPNGVVATALEIVTPSYDEVSFPDRDPRLDLCSYAVTPTYTPAQNILRGVFLAIAAADGGVRFVDVYDLDAPCRGGGATGDDCTTPTISTDTHVYIRRHRPRGSTYTATFGGVTLPPVFVLGPATFPIAADGRGEVIPDLLPLDVCPTAPGATGPHLRPVYRTTLQVDGRDVTTTFVCGQEDPFALVPEVWSAAWEGAIPGTGTSSGNARDLGATIEIDSRVDYCARGVIGIDDAANGLPADAPEQGYVGDLLALTGALPAGAVDRAVCRAVVGIVNPGETQLPILVPIRQAFSRPEGQALSYVGRLVVDADAQLRGRVPFADAAGTRMLTLRDALGCFEDQLLTMEVRSTGAYTVLGTQSGFRTRVVRDLDDGHCAWDGTLDVLAQGRALPNRIFFNARIAFGLSAAESGNPDLRITVTATTGALGIDLTNNGTGVRQISQPTFLSWSEPLARLYAVDTQRRGLVEITMLPIGTSSTRFE